MQEFEDEEDPTALVPTGEDWDRLAELRELFLSSEGGFQTVGYWNSRRDFELYDATFAERIGWKWDAVLAELALRGRLPTATSVVDFGCGTGIASRRFVAAVPGVKHVYLSDRSKQATWFARDALKLQAPKLELTLHLPRQEDPIDVLLASHVLGELDADGRAELTALARRAQFVLLVEPGSHLLSRTLGGLREELLDSFDVLAPCTHAATCGMFAAGHDDDWCHFFARPAPEAFTSAFWRHFSTRLGIDLRALPYSFLALRRKGEPLEARGLRVLGRPRLLKGRALLDCCDATGVHSRTLFERDAKKLFKRLDRSGEILVADARVEGERLHEFRPLGSE